MNLEVTLDRFEGKFAILLVRDEETTQINFPVFLLPPECEEGDILDITIRRNTEKTELARKKAADILERLKTKQK